MAKKSSSQSGVVRIALIGAGGVIFARNFLKDLLTKKYAGKGISLEMAEGGLSITASIIVKYRCNVQDVAVKVQDAILSAVHDMTNYQVSAVNVNVVNIQITDGEK